MNLKSLDNRLFLILIAGIIFLSSFNGISFAQESTQQAEIATQQPTSSKATDVYGVVERIIEENDRVINGQKEHYQRLTIRLDEHLPDTSTLNLGRPKTQVNRVTVENALGDNPAYQLSLKPGSRVLLSQQEEIPLDDQASGNPVTQYSVISLDRTPGLWILLTLSILGLFLIGGQQLTRAMALWLLFTMSAWNLLLPLIVAGSGTAWLLLGFLCALLPLALNSLHKVDNGLSSPEFAHWKQSICTQSVWAGTLIQACILYAMHGIAQLNGHTSTNLNELWELHPQMQYWALYVFGALLGFQGFLYLLCHRSLESLRESQFQSNGDEIPFKARYWLMWDTSRPKLIPIFMALGFLSTCFSLPLMLEMQNNSLAQFINQETVASAITFILSGCLALLLTLPAMSFLVARGYPKVK